MFKKLLDKRNKKGFTLAELLIVVAIIAVLVAISIPIFTTQLEKSKEATDLANIRAAYAEASVAALNGDNSEDGSATSVAMTQNAGWDYQDPYIAGVTTQIPSVSKGQYVTVTVNGETGDVTFSVGSSAAKTDTTTP